MKKILKLSACVILSVTAILFSIAAYAAIVTADASFDINKLSSPSDTNEYFDQSGKIIESANKNEPVKIRLENLPAHVKYAFIAIEDKRFYRHRGVDIKRMAAAALKNVKNKGFKEGASTISQQLIKNTHLSNEKTLKRKLKEIKLTLKLEKSLTKDQILEAYLNTIYFGEGAYGIERAARTYFYKSAAELDLHESATLAAVIKAPSVYSPFLNPDKTAERRNLVLKRMREQKYITENDYSSEIGKPLGAIRDDSANAYSYMNCAKREAEEIISSLPLGYYESYDIYTYLDAELNELLQNETKERPVKSNYLAVLTDNISHGVTALSSDVYEIKRCPASTVKPWLVYAPAIYENEISLATKILDEQTDFNGFYPCNNKGVYHGYVSVKEALSKSLNVPSVKVANCLGLKKMKDYAAKMNIELEGGLGVAIGGIDDGMTLREICDCYSVFSGKGCFTESKFIKKITLKNGKTVYERAASSKKVFDEATAFIVNDALKECAENGTAKKISIKNLNLYAKTGTNGNTDGNFDAYTVSFTPEYTLGVWLGNADNTPLPNYVSGGTYPAIISSEIWKTLSKIRENTDFNQPDDVVKIRLDKSSYDRDQAVYSGNDGEEFYFARGREPKPADRKSANRVYDVEQNCNDGRYRLTFFVEGYDGATLYKNTNGVKSEIKEFAAGKCEYTETVKNNTEYCFLIIPFRTENGKRVYGEPVELQKIKYKKTDSLKPPENDWWIDE